MNAASREVLGDGELVTVARFQSAAEAGYFADELESLESIRAILTSVDDFNAAAGSWSATIHLRVAADEAKRAAAALRDLVAATSDDSDGSKQHEHVPANFELAGEPISRPIAWLPIVLSFAAGSAALFAVQSVEKAAAREQRGDATPLLNALSDSRRPWVQRLPGGGERELRTDSAGALVLREDLDADGRFERTISYPTRPR